VHALLIGRRPKISRQPGADHRAMLRRAGQVALVTSMIAASVSAPVVFAAAICFELWATRRRRA
jgi:hypothetical protein